MRPAARIGALSALLACLSIACLFMACPGSAASADPLQDGAAAFARKDAATAMHLLSPLTEAGDPVAGCMVTVMLDQARGRVAYDADAMAATCIGAADGQASAELDLAGDYRSGRIVTQDLIKAAALYRRAADRGSAVAQKVLGDLYAAGAGVPRDFAAACSWWGRAALQGESSEAQRDLGNCYLAGTGVPKSEVQALAWWLIARAHEDKNTEGLPSWVFQRDADADRLTDALTRRLSPTDVAQAQAFARAWRPEPE